MAGWSDWGLGRLGIIEGPGSLQCEADGCNGRLFVASPQNYKRKIHNKGGRVLCKACQAEAEKAREDREQCC